MIYKNQDIIAQIVLILLLFIGKEEMIQKIKWKKIILLQFYLNMEKNNMMNQKYMIVLKKWLNN